MEKRTKVPIKITIKALTLIVAILALGVSVYNTRHQARNTVGSRQVDLSFPANCARNALCNAATFDVRPIRGRLHGAVWQTTGTLGTTYRLERRSGNMWQNVRVFSNPRNGVPPMDVFILDANGTSTYHLRVFRTSNESVRSTAIADVGIR